MAELPGDGVSLPYDVYDIYSPDLSQELHDSDVTESSESLRPSRELPLASDVSTAAGTTTTLGAKRRKSKKRLNACSTTTLGAKRRKSKKWLNAREKSRLKETAQIR